jgi:diguanylate cyclase (GGDEF)-like protein
MTSPLYDPHTGLTNADLFNDRLIHALERTKRDDRILGLVLIELDDFAPETDVEHDKVLRAVAQRIRSCTRKVDTAGRIDEVRFGVIVEGATTRDHVTEIANKVVHQMEQPFVFEGVRTEVSASIGVSLFPLDAQDADRMNWNAETAMLKARNAGGNLYRLFDEDHLAE